MYFFLRIIVLNPYNYIEPKTVNIEVKALNFQKRVLLVTRYLSIYLSYMTRLQPLSNPSLRQN